MNTLKRLSVLIIIMTLITALNASDVYELPGQIAYIGTDYNVYSINLEHGDSATLTTDAHPDRRYLWPTWSSQGELAYFCCEITSTGQQFTEAYVSLDGIETGHLVYTAQDAYLNYASWSPVPCDVDGECRDLSVLISVLRENQLAVDRIRLTRQVSSYDAEILRLAQGAPFYYTWHPDGQSLLTHRNIARLDNFDIASGQSHLLPYPSGSFSAPQWSPVDDRLLIGIRSESQLTNLAIITGDDMHIIQPDLVGQVAFNWSPNGKYIAYRTVTNGDVSPLTVLDSTTGKVIATNSDDGVFAFFWSPDSRYIAYITIATPPGTFNISQAVPQLVSNLRQEDGLRWTVLNVDSGLVRDFGSFVPSSEMIYLLTYFSQFAQSHSIWSPDSSHIVFSEVQSQGRRVISILDTTRPDAVPFSIAEGVIGIWSNH